MKCVARTLAAFSILAALAAPAASQEVVHWDVVDDIRTEGLDNSQVMEYAGYLTDVIGPRLTASPNMREAQEYVMDQLRALGLSAIVREPWGEEAVGWEVQRVSVHMTAPDYQMVIAYPYALTPGTDGPIVTQAVNAVIETRADLAKYRGRLDGAIVLATPPMPTSPRFVQDAFRHTDESLRVFETEGRDVISQTYARGQLEQSTFRREGISEAEVEEF